MARRDVLRTGAPAISYFGHKIRPGGLSEYFDPTGVREAYTSTCAHCQVITETNTARELREKTNVCRGCMKLICVQCGNKPCLPWEKQCEYQEREYLRQRIEKDGWGCY